MKLLAAFAALVIATGAGVAPAFARDSYVIDNAHILSSATVSLVNAKVSDFNAQAHKEVVVVTQPSFTGTRAEAEERAFAQNSVNGVMIYVAKQPKTIAVVVDRAGSRFFPSGTTSAIRTAIRSSFNSGDFNGGITNGVDLTLAQYRSHLGSLRTTTHAYAPVSVPAVSSETGGFNMGIIWWLIALAVIFFVVRGIFRAIAGPRMYPPGYGGGGPMGGGYGPGYGGGGFGGGGGFWSGMLGGLGGAFLGNELFGRGGEFNQGGQQAGFNDGGQNIDNSGFQSDAGQADMGNSSSGGWGDSGGGWGGDSGGGGGDFGGGGGDSGGGGW